jgi:hypothetical protein
MATCLPPATQALAEGMVQTLTLVLASSRLLLSFSTHTSSAGDALERSTDCHSRLHTRPSAARAINTSASVQQPAGWPRPLQ